MIIKTFTDQTIPKKYSDREKMTSCRLGLLFIQKDNIKIFVQPNSSIENTAGFSGIGTRIVIVECEHADYLTTVTGKQMLNCCLKHLRFA